MVIKVPRKVAQKNGKFKMTTIFIVPKEFNVETQLNAYKKKRGIYEAVIYDSSSKITGSFNFSSLKDRYQTNEIVLQNATIHFFISDLKGLSKGITLKWGNQVVELNQQITIPEINDITFSTEINLKGSDNFWFYPVAKQTKIKVNSNW